MSAARYLAARSVADRVVAACALVVAAPVLLVASAAIVVTMGRPVLFRQQRIGQGGRPFSIVKLRTMVRDAERLGGGYVLPGMDLVPPLGRVLRSTSLDELPQLWNVLVGDMAFVGPRPALPDQYERYTARQRGRVAVPQGITGLAQVRHRDAAPWSTRIEADLEYVATVSPLVDARLLLATVRAVVRRDGIVQHQTPADIDDLGDRRSSDAPAPPPRG
ncbi:MULTISPECIES: sugar transferase [unclassified Agrococcus]|uniref:sugar transferase n=1 Tax=unclassified Agrococcus TaxID=2615065 RepID=UPI00360B4E24